MIPYSTDAPIYHYPISTVCMIVINVILFFAFCLEDATPEFLSPEGIVYEEPSLVNELRNFDSIEEAKAFAETLRPTFTNTWKGAFSLEFNRFFPWQWLTCNFMHDDLAHLVGNMIFLWSFGLVVEGKLGWLSFTAIYLGIGTFYGFVLQMLSLSLGWEGIALGASAAIFGLLALCVAWVPANEFSVLWGFTATFDISILAFAGFYVLKEVVFWWLGGFGTSSEFLHLLGFFVAFPLGLWLVTSGRVDCEGWDLFSYLNGRTGRDSTIGVKSAESREKKSREKEYQKKTATATLQQKVQMQPSAQSQQFHAQVDQAIDRGEFELAVLLQNKLSASNLQLGWKQNDLYRVIEGLLKAKKYEAAAKQIEVYIELFYEKRFVMQTTLIKIWLNQNRPKQAYRYIEGLNLQLMEPDQVEQIKKLTEKARKLIQAGATS